MSIFCSIWSCNDEVAEIFGEKGDYVLYRCSRCGKETIFCAKESKVLKNDEEGRAIMKLMMTDPEFSRQCMIHGEFAKVEFDNMFNHGKQEKLKQEIREKYGLAPGFRQPDPVILFQKGLWKSKVEKKAKPKPKPKPKSNSKTKKKGGDNLFQVDGNTTDRYDNMVKVEIVVSNRKNPNDKKDGEKYQEFVDYPPFDGANLSVEAQLERLEKRLEKYVAREDYEKAAKVRDQIMKLKGEK